MRLLSWILVVGSVFVSIGPLVAQAQTKAPTKQRPPLTRSEEMAVASCLGIIRDCQLPDGAFTMVNEGKTPASPVWVAPYFVNHSMLALLAANDVHKNRADVARVGKWLGWSVKNQDPGGFWQDYTGTIARYQGNGMVDAHDSSAAMFLLVAERYQRSGGKVPETLRAAAKRSLKCIQNVTDTDGLTWAKPDYRVKYLMDNIEVYAGLVAAQGFFTKTGDAAEAKAAGDQAEKISKGLKAYWQAVYQSRFAWVQHANGQFEGGLDKIYPHGLAQLFGVSFVSAVDAPFQEVVKTFQPQTTREGVGAERYLIAASRLGDQETKTWRANTVQATRGFNSKNVYIFRPGLVVLALVEGADWMPSPAGEK
ncbi:MAG: hypothetical protein KDA84_18930 [Planctomycetaceae bacterium]|nr:hypothetical protein [Planctomycetaceae bacterium]